MNPEVVEATAKLPGTPLRLPLLFLVMQPHQHWSPRGLLGSQEFGVYLQRLSVRLPLLQGKLLDGRLAPNLPVSGLEPVVLHLSSSYLLQLPSTFSLGRVRPAPDYEQYLLTFPVSPRAARGWSAYN